MEEGGAHGGFRLLAADHLGCPDAGDGAEVVLIIVRAVGRQQRAPDARAELVLQVPRMLWRTVSW